MRARARAQTLVGNTVSITHTATHHATIMLVFLCCCALYDFCMPALSSLLPGS